MKNETLTTVLGFIYIMFMGFVFALASCTVKFMIVGAYPAMSVARLALLTLAFTAVVLIVGIIVLRIRMHITTKEYRKKVSEELKKAGMEL